MQNMSMRSLPGSSLFFFAIPLLFLFSFLIPSIAESGKPPKVHDGLVPAAILKWPETGSDYTLLVDKKKQKIYVYHRETPFWPHRVYQCSTGENNGPKTKKNDRKTPEGIYFFTNSFSKRDLTPIYGVRAFPIDYPNPVDALEGKGGYGIWFHGTNKPLKPYDSNGCIVLENDNIDNLAAFINVQDTPAVITSKIRMTDPETLRRESAALAGMIENWRRAWENKDIDKYISFYSPRFKDRGKDRQAWKEYKARLAQKYRKIKIEIDNLRLLRNDGVLVATFNQAYRTPSFHSEGIKRLYFQQNSKEWKIMGEFFVGKDSTPTQLAPPKISPREEIRSLIEAWEKAWEDKDLKGYIACYDSRFRSRGMNLRSWRKHRQRLNTKYRTLNVGIRDLKINKLSGRSATVSFLQHYQADTYRDVGFKKMLLVRKGGHWKIKKEEWRPLKK